MMWVLIVAMTGSSVPAIPDAGHYPTLTACSGAALDVAANSHGERRGFCRDDPGFAIAGAAPFAVSAGAVKTGVAETERAICDALKRADWLAAGRVGVRVTTAEGDGRGFGCVIPP